MTMRVLSSCLSAFLLLKGVEGGMVQFNPIESLFSGNLIQTGGSRAANSTARLQRDPNAPTPEQREGERANRRERMQERNGRIKDVMQMIRPDTVERVSPEELASLEEEHPSLRKLGWNSWAGNGNSGIQYADPGEDYDMWQQAYRMLGGFIDCDHSQDGEGSHDNNDNQDEHRRQEEGGDAQPCSRWMLWASVSLWHLHVLFHEEQQRSNVICILFFHSTLIPTTKVTDTMSILETHQQARWTVTIRTLNGNYLASTVKSFISLSNKSQNIFGRLTSTNTS
jgi:hypothetical protein